jgi:bifunctional DNA-binding transcriptional regulator/antitoxin component of YhaV-PrlF toxin-antitoxin module
MLVELRNRSQLTIPAEIIREIGAVEGDKFDIYSRDGVIFLCPVVVYPKDKIAKIAKILRGANNLEGYDDVETMFADMGINLDES